MEPTATATHADGSAAATAEPTTRDVPERGRTEVLVDGRVVGMAEYTDAGGARVFTHTEVHDPVGGRGLGTRLALAALDAAVAADRRIVPVCPFVAKVVDAHPEYQPRVDHVLLESWTRPA